MTATHPAYEAVRPVLPAARVLLQRNPGIMTLDGTNTWLLGTAAAPVVVDPGQALDDGHLDRLLAAAPSPSLVLLTHRHHDHTELAAALHERTGVTVRGADPAQCRGGPALADGETIAAAGLTIEVLLTPGHTSDSASFVVTDGSGATAVLTGDTVLGRGTTVVAHPDGDLAAYLASLERLRALGSMPVLPGHGPELPAVADVAAAYLAHRAQRLDQIRAALVGIGDDATARQVVEVVYADVDRELWDAAQLSVGAQLAYLRGSASS
ncbi:Glyoxylase, beta-lactamase superfamily II [Jatrophihabitans endophyticus]|uniref:Glyoxylase, beta-lactamase superfamily II n=1 Tax=Jatrophihabitans endophyticus TaxID=1206085 RepID=A0A1M5H3T4_9ACTN|nr:MBL fold metallo-hydrolase [Jatrophihabitans endophyticus]SHG10604.1 Glyoxylase, beta-lactamase superfamily II [Jatrophihabitans endophyticus]